MNIFPPEGLYIHVPFCVCKCRYCDFYSFPAGEDLYDAYTERVMEALGYYEKRYARRYNSLYFGGGTPLLLGEKRLGKITERALPLLEQDSEITAEGNPAAAGEIDFAALRAAGINRLSFGLQSSNERELSALGRIHSPKDAADTVAAAQKAGFDNISLDLMLGIPYQTEETLKESVAFCANLGVRHISAYMLKVEEGTPLASSELRFLCADEEKNADLYLLACGELESRGYKQYEISNFAKPGFESRHNLKYWLDGEYLGIGPSAHSFMEGRRFFFGRDMVSFMEKPFGEIEREESPGGGWEEYAMLRLRLAAGLDTEELGELYPDSPAKEILSRAALYERPGLTKIEGTRVSFTPRGFLVSSALTAELLYD